MSVEPGERPRSALIVWSDYREMGARLPDLFHQAGIAVDLLGAEHRVLTLSRHIRRSLHCEREAMPAVLKSHLANPVNAYDWVILGDEATLYALIDDPTEDWSSIFPVEYSGIKPRLITSKALFTNLCREQGIALPPSVVCSRAEELEAAAAGLGYPVMVKSDRGCAGNGVRKLQDAADLPQTLQHLSEGPWIVQKFIAGRVGSTQLLLDHGKPVCWFASLKHTVWPPPFGPSCVRELFSHPEMLTRLEQIGELTGFHGLCGVDWIVDEHNTLYILELNARPTPCCHLGPFAGVDFSLALRQIAQGGPVTVQTPRDPQPKNPLVYMWPQYGYYCLYYGRLWGLLRFLPGAANTDLRIGEPHILRYNTFRFAWECARHFKHSTLRRLRRRALLRAS